MPMPTVEDVSRRRPARRPAETALRPSNERVETWAGEDYTVRSITGSSSTKVYRCPGCDHEIRPATPHVVVWASADDDANHRRHWHSACWRARNNRSPKGFR